MKFKIENLLKFSLYGTLIDSALKEIKNSF